MTAASDGADGYRERFYTSEDNLALYFRDYGDPLAPATPVLCLAGLTRNSKDFHDFASRLAPRRRVLCPDYRGRGRSAYDPDWRHYLPRIYTNDLLHLLAATNLHRVVVVGTSLGGTLAMGLAVAAPSALKGVILNDIGPEMNMEWLGRLVDYIGVDRPQPDCDAAVREMKAKFPALSFADAESWNKVVRNTYREGEDGMLHFDWDVRLVKPLLDDRLEGTGPPFGLWPLFRALRRVPTLALRGEVSEVLDAATFARMAEEKPDLVRVTVPGVGHAPTLAEAEARAAVDDFLARL